MISVASRRIDFFLQLAGYLLDERVGGDRGASWRIYRGAEAM